MFSLKLLSLLCYYWRVVDASRGAGIFSFEKSATGPVHVCPYTAVQFYCTVTFTLNGDIVIIRDAAWKVNGTIITNSNPDYSLLHNSNLPSQIVGLQINHARPYDNGTVYTCTDDLAPDNFTSIAILNITDNGCGKHKLGAPEYIGIAIGVLSFWLLLLVLLIICICITRKLLKKNSRNRRYRILDDSAFSVANETVDDSTVALPNDLPTNVGPSDVVSSTSQDDHEQPEEIVIDNDDTDHTYHNCDQRLIEQVWEVCNSKFSMKQIISILELTDQNGNQAVEFLMLGPSLQRILTMLLTKSQDYPVKIIEINQSTQCSDLVTLYKDPDIDFSNCNLVICLHNAPAIDAGGVRRQIYTRVLKQLSENEHSPLFQGRRYHLRPYYTASAMDTEIFKVLGCIVGHSIAQEGIGFPYLSPLCYWYIAAGKNTAMLHYTDDDVGAACNYLITKLNEASTVDEVAEACSMEGAQDLLESAKVNMQVKLDNKDQVVQLLKVHEALFSIKILLDQFKVGLKKVKVLHLIQSFPTVFAPLFIFTGETSADEIVKALCLGSGNEDVIAMEFLKQYISGLSQEDIQSFMICITGTMCIQDQKITVNFSDELEQIKISTCSREIFMPFGLCKKDEYGKFKSIMDAATLDDYRFNHV